jgi:hypothetical protein
MYRDNRELQYDNRMNFVLNNGALGDVITSLPAMIYGRQRRHESMEMRVWAPSWQHDLLAHLLAPYGKFVMRKLEEFPFARVVRQANDDWGGGPVAINGFLHNNHTRNATNMVDFAFSCLLDASPSNMNDRSYPVLAPLGARTIEGKYILIPTNATSENKTFRAVVMRPVIEWALAAGYKVVLTGTKTSHTKVDAGGTFRPIVMLSEVESLADLLPKCIDMREKTTLLELRDLCGYASAVVGVDGGTIHIAGTTMAPIVYGLTTTHPRHRFVARMGSPHFQIKYVTPRNLECAGCQSNWVLSFWDFTRCPYEDNLCTYRLHPQDFTDGLKELGL